MTDISERTSSLAGGEVLSFLSLNFFIVFQKNRHSETGGLIRSQDQSAPIGDVGDISYLLHVFKPKLLYTIIHDEVVYISFDKIKYYMSIFI